MTDRRYRGSGHPGVAVDRNPGAASRISHGAPEGLRLRLTGWAWTVAWELVRRLPEALVFGLADVAGRVAARRAGPDHQLRRNLARVVEAEALDTAVAEAFRSYARYWVEAFRAADLDPADLDRRTTTEGFEHLDAALDGGRGAIALLAHHGSWDIAAQWGETHGYHLAVVAEVVRPRRVFERFVRLRESVGLEVVPHRRGQDRLGRLREVLAANHIVGLLSERDLSGRGPVVELFGEEARLPTGAVRLSQETGAPIVPVTVLQRPGRRWHAQALPPVDIAGAGKVEAVQRVAQALEDLIRLDPVQWHAFQPVWLRDLSRRRRGGWTPPEEQQAAEGEAPGTAAGGREPAA